MRAKAEGLFLVLCSVGIVGCDAGSAVRTDAGVTGPSPTYGTHAWSTQAACYAVAGTVHLEATPTSPLTGVIGGDLEGTVTPMVIPDPQGSAGPFTGAALHLLTEMQIQVTGGRVAEVVGRTLRSAGRGVQVGKDFPNSRLSDHQVFFEGADGSLTLHGFSELRLAEELFVVDFTYRGTICP